MRDDIRSIIGVAVMMNMMEPAGSHQIGPGERKNPAPGRLLKMEPTHHTTGRDKSKSLKRLLRK